MIRVVHHSELLPRGIHTMIKKQIASEKYKLHYIASERSINNL
ncbi:MAG: hypothetical protein RIR48_993 [Bacteroidota bacterium]